MHGFINLGRRLASKGMRPDNNFYLEPGYFFLKIWFMKSDSIARPTDQHIVHLIHEKDDRVFNILYQKYWPSLLNFAENYIEDRDTCKEIVQELIIALYTRRSRLTIHISLSSYLYSSLRNKILNHLRDRSTYNRHIKRASRINGRGTEDNQVEEFINLMELRKKIDCCLGKMPVKCREVYLLHKQHQYTLKKTSEILCRPVDTVEKQFRKAIHLLRDQLSEQ
jgi:RNA polymerase sigma-70 factor (ECF subfamily)